MFSNASGFSRQSTSTSSSTDNQQQQQSKSESPDVGGSSSTHLPRPGTAPSCSGGSARSFCSQSSPSSSFCGSNSNNETSTPFQKFNEAFNSFGKVFDDVTDNIKDSFDEFSKNFQDMNNFFNVTANKTACNSCNANFSIFVRKRKCSKCSLIFCGQCMIYNPMQTKKSVCNRCMVFAQRPMSKEGLQSLKVRDLKWFLASKNIPSRHCYEKSELVELIISVSDGTFQHQNSSSQNGQQERRHSFDGQAPSFSEANSEHNGNTTNCRQRSTTETNPPSSSTFYETASHSSPSFVSQNNEASKLGSVNITLDDLQDEDQIKTLTVKQLKILLTRNFVNFKGCVERDELIAKVELLYRDKKQNDALKEKIDLENQNPGTSSETTQDGSSSKTETGSGSSYFYSGADENQCKICWEKVIDCVLLDCGHMLTCTDCGKVLNECPVCRQFISRVVHVFRS